MESVAGGIGVALRVFIVWGLVWRLAFGVWGLAFGVDLAYPALSSLSSVIPFLPVKNNRKFSFFSRPLCISPFKWWVNIPSLKPSFFLAFSSNFFVDFLNHLAFHRLNGGLTFHR
jgi:hypothetical protein